MAYKTYPCGCRELCPVRPTFIKTIAVIVDGGEVVLVVPPQVFDNGEQIRLCIAQNIPLVTSEETVYIQAGYTGENRFQITTSTGEQVYSMQLCSRTIYPMTASTNNGGFIVNPRYLRHSGEILTKVAPTTPDTPAENNVSPASLKGGASK